LKESGQKQFRFSIVAPKSTFKFHSAILLKKAAKTFAVVMLNYHNTLKSSLHIESGILVEFTGSNSRYESLVVVSWALYEYDKHVFAHFSLE